MLFKEEKAIIPPLDSEFIRRAREELEISLKQGPAPGTCNTRQPFSRIPFCGRKTFGSSEFCYWHLPDFDKYSPNVLREYFGEDIMLAKALEREIATGASLEGFFLPNCNLGGDLLTEGPSLVTGKFIFANLRGASMSQADLTSALFLGADLTRAKLSSCLLSGANFTSAKMFETKFRDNDLRSVKGLERASFRGVNRFGFAVDRMLEEYPEQAAPMYRELTSYFAVHGQLDDASWAAYRASVLQHRILRKEFGINAIKTRRFQKMLFPSITPVQTSFLSEYLRGFTRWSKSGIFLLITGYGERPLRVIVTAMLAILVYAGLYSVPNAITGHGFYNALYFSIITFTTLGYGDVLPNGGFRLVAGSEALCGILFTGLFLFCIGRKTVSRG